jgi:hypothetical protein
MQRHPGLSVSGVLKPSLSEDRKKGSLAIRARLPLNSMTGPGDQQLFRTGLSYYFFFFPFLAFFFVLSFFPFFAFFSFFFAIVSSSFFNVFLRKPTLLWLLLHPGGKNCGCCLRSAYVMQTFDAAGAHVSRITAAF